VLELASQMKAPVLFIECRAEDSEIRRRLIEREKRGHNPSDADVSVYLRQVQDFVPLSEIPGANHLMVDTWRPLRAIVSDAERALAGRQRRLQSP
jgi:predicted kinase